METKKCTKCDEIKFLDEYSYRSGHGYKARICRTCNGTSSRRIELEKLAKRGLKRCIACDKIKKINSFSVSKKRIKSGELKIYVLSECNNCKKIRNRKYYQCLDKEKKAIRQREYYLKNKEAITIRNANWKNNNPEKVKDSKLKWRRKNYEKTKAASIALGFFKGVGLKRADISDEVFEQQVMYYKLLETIKNESQTIN